jgi:hypothetical protein
MRALLLHGHARLHSFSKYKVVTNIKRKGEGGGLAPGIGDRLRDKTNLIRRKERTTYLPGLGARGELTGRRAAGRDKPAAVGGVLHILHEHGRKHRF